jgi:hypothetical protein
MTVQLPVAVVALPIGRQRDGNTRVIVPATLLVVALIAGVWFWIKPSTRPGVEPGREVADAFLGLIREGKPGEAWDATTAEFKSAQGREAFLRTMKQKEFLRQPVEFVSIQEVQVGQEPRSEYLFRAPEKSPSGSEVRVVIGYESGAWKVDRVIIQ